MFCCYWVIDSELFNGVSMCCSGTQSSIAPTRGWNWNRLCPWCDGSSAMIPARLLALGMYVTPEWRAGLHQ